MFPVHLMHWFCPNGCVRGYLVKGSLHRHIRYECSVVKKFICELCGRAFARKESYKGHMLHRHKVLPWKIWAHSTLLYSSVLSVHNCLHIMHSYYFMNLVVWIPHVLPHRYKYINTSLYIKDQEGMPYFLLKNTSPLL